MSEDKYPRLMVLNEPNGRRHSNALAIEIGKDHADVLLQIEYLISISSTPMVAGRMWTRQSVANLQFEQFPYWGRSFIARILQELVNGYEHIRYTYEGKGRTFKRVGTRVSIPPLLDAENHNNWPGDTTLWYSLNAKGIATLKSVSLVKMDGDGLTVSTTRKRVSTVRQRVTGHAATRYRKRGNFYSENPTETPTERGGAGAKNEMPPEPTPPPPVELLSLEEAKNSGTISTKLAIRTDTKPQSRGEIINAMLERNKG